MKGDFDTLITRLAKLRGNLSPDSVKVKTALIRIGTVLSSQMKINSPIVSGNLRNRINYLLRKTDTGAEVVVGSFATPYAAIVEFGYNGTQSVRQHERIGRTSGKLGTVRAYSRTVNREPHRTGGNPGFIRPAISKHEQFILDQIRSITEP